MPTKAASGSLLSLVRPVLAFVPDFSDQSCLHSFCSLKGIEPTAVKLEDRGRQGRMI